MREPFSRLLGPRERLVAAREVDSAVRTGPLAMPAELLALASPVLSLFLYLRLDDPLARLLGVVLPPAVLVLAARFPLRRWRRPRTWIALTGERLLIWRRPAALFAGPRIEAVSLAEIVDVALEQDEWDRRVGRHQLIVHTAGRARNLGRIAAAEQFRDAVRAATTPMALHPKPADPTPRPGDFIPR